MKGIVVILSFVHCIFGSQGHIHEEYKQLSYSKLRSLYAQHYDNYTKFVKEYKQGIVDERPEPYRLLAYAKTLEEIHNHNKLYEEGKSTYKLGLNHMADMTFEEYNEMLPTIDLDIKPTINVSESIPELPKTFSWVDKGAVTPIKDVKFGYGCYAAGAALSVAGSLEALVKIRSKRLIQLSAQELLDCTGYGCDTFGNPKEYLKYVMNKNGLHPESRYPWTGKQGYCRSNATKRFGPIGNYISMYSDSLSLKAAVYHRPMIVVVYANSQRFKNYQGGIFREVPPGRTYSHTMLIVGYGEDYFLLKNSWGESWGENGYMRITTDPDENDNVSMIAIGPL